jgi:hypothetical protein
MVVTRFARPAAALAITTKLDLVVLFFEIMLVVAVLVISWFALYTLYRLITDES